MKSVKTGGNDSIKELKVVSREAIYR
jgi:hypothetical protein